MINFDVIRVLKEFYGKNEVKKSTKDHLNVLQHTILNEQATKNLYVSLMPYPSAWKKMLLSRIKSKLSETKYFLSKVKKFMIICELSG